MENKFEVLYKKINELIFYVSFDTGVSLDKLSELKGSQEWSPELTFITLLQNLISDLNQRPLKKVYLRSVRAFMSHFELPDKYYERFEQIQELANELGLESGEDILKLDCIRDQLIEIKSVIEFSKSEIQQSHFHQDEIDVKNLEKLLEVVNEKLHQVDLKKITSDFQFARFVEEKKLHPSLLNPAKYIDCSINGIFNSDEPCVKKLIDD